MRGQEGVGKNTFVGALGKLFGRHFFEGSTDSQFTGQFNSHLQDKIFVHANEAFFAGDKRHEGTLKAMITDPMMPIEAKGRRYQNCRQFHAHHDVVEQLLGCASRTGCKALLCP